jgi:CDP-diacylglycerol--glycerol-3-phosphate 3-phosphatidyltransferase
MLKTPADWITAARFVLSLALFAVLWRVENMEPAARSATAWVCFALFVTAALTDTVDGIVARRTGLSEFGRVADPFVDKVLVVGSLVFLIAIPETRRITPAWSVVLVVAREFLVTGVRGYAESRGIAFPADAFGKIKMVLQCVAVGGGLLCLAGAGAPARGGIVDTFWEHVPTITAMVWWVAVAGTVGSGLGYCVRAWKIIATDVVKPR